jgi:DNA gyrase/topoisomerase IV subunit A
MVTEILVLSMPVPAAMRLYRGPSSDSCNVDGGMRLMRTPLTLDQTTTANLLEPLVLPAAFPNLLVNGGSGIAVGMATNMAPHNLGEVIAATKFLIENPKATLNQLMKLMPAPDFPTGGEIVGLDGVREAYATGKGSFRVRASVEISKVTSRKMGLIIKELPFNIGT